MKSSFAIILSALAISAVPTTASAVSNANAINWTAPAPAFVTSLYVGVLGRAPESAAVVTGWAAQVTSKPASRLRVFHMFVGSPEYRGKNPRGTRGRYVLWTNNCPKSPSNRYVISTHMPRGSWSPNGGGRISYGYARALMGYYLAYVPFRRCR